MALAPAPLVEWLLCWSWSHFEKRLAKRLHHWIEMVKSQNYPCLHFSLFSPHIIFSLLPFLLPFFFLLSFPPLLSFFPFLFFFFSSPFPFFLLSSYPFTLCASSRGRTSSRRPAVAAGPCTYGPTLPEPRAAHATAPPSPRAAHAPASAPPRRRIGPPPIRWLQRRAGAMRSAG
jgi:hypothetical protein